MIELPYRLVLGSKSPRRYELLSGLDIPFEVRTIDGLEESYPPELNPEEIPLYLAKFKALALLSTLESNELLLTADTVVILSNGEVLGKPTNMDEAKIMLKKLSANKHTVITGIAFSQRDGLHFADIARSEVFFSSLTDEEINYYLKHYKPFDKAGAYGIQEWIGYIGIEGIKGSFYNVMGLPIQLIYKTLCDWQLYKKNIVPL